jgi:hypothetical protein
VPAKTNPRHKRPTPSRARQGVALGVTTVVSATAVVAGSGVANAADKPVSQGTGVFLSGFALGKSLDDIVKLDSAAAANMGDKDTVSDINPLGVTLLNSLNVPLGPVNLLKGNGLLTLGAVNQAAVAKKDGSAVAGSGAVSDSGAIAVGGKDGVPASTAKLDLGALLGSTLGTDLVGGLADLDLSVGAISASADQAKGENGKQTGDYNIASLKLNLQSPLLANLLGGLDLTGGQSQLDGLSTTLNGLNLNSLLSGLLGGLLGTPSVAVANVPVLSDIVADQDLTVGDGAVTVNLSNGKITVDVEALLKKLGLDLNNLPPNTELVRLILNALTDHITDLVKDVVKGLADDITDAVADINITGSAIPLIPGPAQALPTAGLLAALQPTLDTVLGTVLDPVSDLLGQVGSTLLDPLFDALESVLSIRVNVQNKAGGAFTERAIQIRVLPDGAGVNTAAASDSLATVNLASASVGPGSGQVLGEGDDTPSDGGSLPDTGAGDASAPLAAIGFGMVLAGAAATAGAGMGNRPAGAHAGERGRGRRSGGGRHRR